MKRWKMPVRLEEDAIGAYVEYGDAIQAIEEAHQSYGGLPSKCDELQRERDHANMTCDAAAGKIKELEARVKELEAKVMAEAMLRKGGA